MSYGSTGRFWSVGRRVHYSLVALAALALTWQLVYWNLLGFRTCDLLQLENAQPCCAGYLDDPFPYLCTNDELSPNLSLSIHRTGKVFHIAHLPLLLERISQVE
jgi:hypothetical protein